ncbi:BTB/POZ and MATH domain-containing protein 2 [Rhynchospora pubera]|uniref:BTB/POZ and MATH domain-containing protein 2 n=1 Tax=Rhynchospora pubera TaxID=906938 RepID=A0AAV8HLA9_9POAL|nr:BTB/POZ and MATH domain-containing protein 2 [Rhynchospora pubera]KAJ4817419.1 BTB/POZ and MATH domain-containing protein 2 [Rhynchospora pubera]
MNQASVANGLITVVNSDDCSFKINYEESRNFVNNSFLRSPIFMCSGYEWSLRYFPRESQGLETSEYISLYLDLESHAENISTSVTFYLLGKDMRPLQTRHVWSLFRCKGSSEGFRTFIKKSLLESEFIRDGWFVLRCDIRVMNGEWEETSLPDEISAPPFRHLYEELYELLKRKEMTDVVIEVAGESMEAHRLVLAARSPLFKELITKATPRSNCIKVNYVTPVVFKVVLHFMYTDALPPVNKLFDGDSTEGNVDLYGLTQEVLVAADEYKLHGLKIICEEKLAKHLSMETVVSSLDLAQHHNCQHLKKICFEFAAKPENIKAFMRSDGFVELMKRCPTLLAQYVAHITDFPPSQ